MKEIDKNELMGFDGGTMTNYIGGLGPAIPESGGAAIVGFFSGFFHALFDF